MSGKQGPWAGRKITEQDLDQALQPRRPWTGLEESLRRHQNAPTVTDFREVGLGETDATRAVEGLQEGRFLSFEDACLSVALFGASKAVTLDETAMREKARQFAGVSS